MLQRSHRTNVLFLGILLSIVVVFCVGRFLLFHAGGVRTGPLSIRDRLVLPATAGLVVARADAPGPVELLRVPGRVHGPEGAPPDESLRVVARDRVGGGLVAEAVVDAEGAFELHLPAQGGEGWRIELDGRFLFLPAPLELLAGREGSLELEAELGAWVTAGLLAPGADGQGSTNVLEAARLLLRPAAESEGETGLEAWRRLARATDDPRDPEAEGGHASGTGGFELRAVPTAGGWRLTAAVEGFMPLDLLLEGLLPGEHRHLTLELAPGERVAGRGVDAEGTPLAGVRVEARGVGQASEPLFRSAETAADGTFVFSGLPPGELELAATHEGFLPAEPLAVEPGTVTAEGGLVLALHRGAAIAGRIAWEDGQPAAGERVSAVRDGPAGERVGGGASAISGEDGAFRVEGLAPGTYTLRADVERRSAAGVLEVASVRAPGIPAAAAPGTTVHLNLSPRLPLAGVVADRTGRPVHAFRVRAWAEESGAADETSVEHAFDTDDGTFRLAAFTAGAWRVVVDAPGHLASAPRRLVLPAVEDGPVRFVLPAASAVAGLVLGTDGEPRPGALVRVRTPGGATLQGVGARADAHGRFRVDGLAPGRLGLVAEAEGEVASETSLLDLERGRVLDHLVLRLRGGGWIEGTALDHAGRPAPGRLVHVARMDPSVHRSARADGTGRFRIERLLPGEWQAWCQGDGAVGAIESAMVLVRDGVAADLVLGGAPPEAVLVSGRVVDALGPLAASIQFLAEGRGPIDGMKLASAGEDGRFEALLDRPGRYLALVRPRADGGDTVTAARPLALPLIVPAGGIDALSLTLPDGRVAGRVVGPDGRGLAGAHVRLAPAGALPIVVPPGAGVAEHRTDGAGRFAFEHLEPGAWAVTAAPGARGTAGVAGLPYGRSVVRVEVPDEGPVEDLELALAPGGGVAGRVVGPEGRSVPAARVWVRAADGTALERVSAVTTDASGRFHLPPLAPGGYTLVARDRESAAVLAEPIQVGAGETAETELTLAPGAALVVATVDLDGEPLPARLAVRDVHGREVGGFAGADEAGTLWERGYTGARRRLGPLVPGSYRVRAETADGREAERTVELAPGDTIEVVLVLVPAELPGPTGTH